ncbi:MAG: hypothetical protein FWH54_00550 [Methanobrevibacter sp.]|nr:hypothetical protein [Methanobrevibacter sp.]
MPKKENETTTKEKGKNEDNPEKYVSEEKAKNKPQFCEIVSKYTYPKNEIYEIICWALTGGLLGLMTIKLYSILFNETHHINSLICILIVSFIFLLTFFKAKSMRKMNIIFRNLKNKDKDFQDSDDVEYFDFPKTPKYLLPTDIICFISNKKISAFYILKKVLDELVIIFILCILATAFSKYFDHQLIGIVLIFLLTIIISYYIIPKWNSCKLKYKFFSSMILEMMANLEILIKNQHTLNGFLLWNSEKSFLDLKQKAKSGKKIKYKYDVLFHLKTSNYYNLMDNHEINLDISKYKNLEGYFNTINSIHYYIDRINDVSSDVDEANMFRYYRLNQEVNHLISNFDLYLNQVNGKFIFMGMDDDKNVLNEKTKNNDIYWDDSTLNSFNDCYGEEWILIIDKNYKV